MVPCLAAQAVVIKMKFKDQAALLSDYEYAYALGYTAGLMGVTLPNMDTPAALHEILKKTLVSYTPATEEEGHLLYMIEQYKPLGTKAEELKILISMGYHKKTV